MDLCGPWTINMKDIFKVKKVEIHALTIVEAAMGLTEIVPIKKKDNLYIAEAFNNTYLSRYPRPTYVLHDNGGEFTGGEFQQLLTSLGIKDKLTTVKNPRANAIGDQVHHTMLEMLV